MTKEETLKLALEALETLKRQEFAYKTPSDVLDCLNSITAIKEALAQPYQEPVAAAKKDAVFSASIEFIGILTGMKPPPIEIAPPEILKPFQDFTEKVCSIFAAPQPAQQEPVAWMYVNTDGECEQIEYGEPFDDPSTTPLYTPPQRTWVGLTDEEVGDLSDFAYANDEEFVRNVEKKIKGKNNG